MGAYKSTCQPRNCAGNYDYTDTAAMPPAGQRALWKYKAIYIQANQRVGQWSDVVSIPVAGQVKNMRQPSRFLQWLRDKFHLQKFLLMNFKKHRRITRVWHRLLAPPACNCFKHSPFASILCLRLLIGVVSVVFASTIPSFGASFKVTGTLEVRNLVRTNDVAIQKFETTVHDESWLIKCQQVSFAPSYTNAMLLTYTSFRDDGVIYTFAEAQDRQSIIDSLVNDPKAPNAWKSHPEQIAINMAWIERAEIPHADMNLCLPIVFYAYCSQNYLDATDRESEPHRLEPPYVVDGRPYAFDEGITNVPASYRRSQSPPFLPQYICFRHNTVWLRGSGDLIQLPKQWELFTNAEFVVDSYTNIDGMVLPSHFVMMIYSASQITRDSALEITPVVQINGRLDSVTPNTQSTIDMHPSIRDYAKFTDKRFSEDGNLLLVRYNTNKWLKTNEVVLLPEFSMAKHEEQFLERRKHIKVSARSYLASHRLVVWVLLTLPTLVLLILLVATRIKHRQTNTKERKTK